MNRLLIASENPGKLLEFQALLEDMPFDLVYPSKIGVNLNVVEDGVTYAENAARKALAYSEVTDLITLADDSGLEVNHLGGLPGLYSARFGRRSDATDADRRTLLLAKLKGRPRPWVAKFHCTIAIAMPVGEVRYSKGECLGEIIPEERGLNGFGYDPIFLLPETGMTMAELSIDEKNQLSHRARAVQAAKPLLWEIYQECKEE